MSSRGSLLCKGPLYVRFEDHWILCQVEVTATKLTIDPASSIQLEWLNRYQSSPSQQHQIISSPSGAHNGQEEKRGSGGGLASQHSAPEILPSVEDSSFSLSNSTSDNYFNTVNSPVSKSHNNPLLLNDVGDSGPAGMSPAKSRGSSFSMQRQQSRQEEEYEDEAYILRQRSLGAFSRTALGMISPDDLSSPLRPPVSSSYQSSSSSGLHHPLVEKTVSVERIREVKLLHCLHYYDKFVFEVVTKKSSSTRIKNKYISQKLPSHFSQSVSNSGLASTLNKPPNQANSGTSKSHSNSRFEVFTFKAPDQEKLFQWIDALEDAVDPIAASAAAVGGGGLLSPRSQPPLLTSTNTTNHSSGEKTAEIRKVDSSGEDYRETLAGPISSSFRKKYYTTQQPQRVVQPPPNGWAVELPVYGQSPMKKSGATERSTTPSTFLLHSSPQQNSSSCRELRQGLSTTTTSGSRVPTIMAPHAPEESAPSKVTSSSREVTTTTSKPVHRGGAALASSSNPEPQQQHHPPNKKHAALPSLDTTVPFSTGTATTGSSSTTRNPGASLTGLTNSSDQSGGPKLSAQDKRVVLAEVGSPLSF